MIYFLVSQFYFLCFFSDKVSFESPLGTINFLQDYYHIIGWKFKANSVDDCMDSSGSLLVLFNS